MAVLPLKPAVAARGYRVVAADSAATIYIYGPIGSLWWSDDGVSANQFRKDLTALGDVKALDVRINSEGGDVFDGQAIYSLLVQHKATVTMHVDGLAASAASFIAMAGNTIEIAESAYMMIHQASGVCFGAASEMRKTADLLDTTNGALRDIYAARTKNKPADIEQMMADETWMTGAQAVEKGFADKMVANLAVAASVRDPSKYRHLPSALRPNRVRAHEVMKQIAATVFAR